MKILIRNRREDRGWMVRVGNGELPTCSVAPRQYLWTREFERKTNSKFKFRMVFSLLIHSFCCFLFLYSASSLPVSPAFSIFRRMHFHGVRFHMLRSITDSFLLNLTLFILFSLIIYLELFLLPCDMFDYN